MVSFDLRIKYLSGTFSSSLRDSEFCSLNIFVTLLISSKCSKDFKLWINDQNQIEYAFYEKPMASNRCLQSETALNQNCLIRSLGNEVGRRLDSCSGSVGVGRRVTALDRFSQKMLNSGHKVETIRNILVSGIKGFKRRVARSPGQWNSTPQKCKPELWC